MIAKTNQLHIANITNITLMTQSWWSLGLLNGTELSFYQILQPDKLLNKEKTSMTAKCYFLRQTWNENV